MTTSLSLDRRAFLKTGAAAGTGLLIAFHLPAFASSAEDQEKKNPNPLNAWVHITPDNHVSLILGKSEMGQGIMTALPMILAEELSLDWSKVKIEQAPTNPAIYEHGTGGSGSIAGSWRPLRRAGAAPTGKPVCPAAHSLDVYCDTCVEHGSAALSSPRN